MIVLESNFLTSLAADVRAEVESFKRSSEAAHGAYLRAGTRLREARKEAKRGEWGPFLQAAGVEARNAQHMMRVAGGDWNARRLSAVGGVRVARDFEALRPLVRGDDADLEPAALAVRKGSAAFLAYCEAHDEDPGDLVRRLADERRREKSEPGSFISKPEPPAHDEPETETISGESARIPDALDERRAEVNRQWEEGQARIQREIEVGADAIKRQLAGHHKPASPAPEPPAYFDTESWPGESRERVGDLLHSFDVDLRGHVSSPVVVSSATRATFIPRSPSQSTQTQTRGSQSGGRPVLPITVPVPLPSITRTPGRTGGRVRLRSVMVVLLWWRRCLRASTRGAGKPFVPNGEDGTGAGERVGVNVFTVDPEGPIDLVLSCGVDGIGVDVAEGVFDPVRFVEGFVFGVEGAGVVVGRGEDSARFDDPSGAVAPFRRGCLDYLKGPFLALVVVLGVMPDVFEGFVHGRSPMAAPGALPSMAGCRDGADALSVNPGPRGLAGRGENRSL